jgi:hypothetical protein
MKDRTVAAAEQIPIKQLRVSTAGTKAKAGLLRSEPGLARC